MPDLPSDDEDSRIASLGAQRNRGSASANASRSGSNTSSRHASHEPPHKRRRRGRGSQSADVQDFVPKGATFSAHSLEVDQDTESTSESGSDSGSGSGDSSESSSESESESESENDIEKGVRSDVGSAHVSAPAPNWNKTGRGVIRTSLRSRQNGNANTNTSTGSESQPAAAEKSELVNGTHGGSRSPSVVSGEQERKSNQEEGDTGAPAVNDIQMEEGEVNGEQEGTSGSQSPASGDSDDSESLDSEADDSIMLNIGSRGHGRSQNDAISISDDSEADDYDPETLPISHSVGAAGIFDNQDGTPNGSAANLKESALLRFAQKYPNAPSTLADLCQEDMELQAKIVFYDRHINDINLQLPVVCMECLREGHLAEVCPTKEVRPPGPPLLNHPQTHTTIPKQTTNSSSVFTAEPGISTKAPSAPSGEDVNDAANVGMTRSSAHLP